MDEQVFDKEEIKRQARAAAEAGLPPSFCAYDKDSAAGKCFLAAYWERELQLSGEESA